MNTSVRSSGQVAVLGVVVLFALLIRYGSSPVTDLTVDDWSFLVHSQQKSWGEIVGGGLRDIYRPVYSAVLTSAFKVAGDAPVLLSMMRLPLVAILLVLILLFVRSLLDMRSAAVAGVALALLPNISEPFYWHCHSILLYIPILYVYSLYAWTRYLQVGGGWRMVLALAAYSIAVFSYEYGVMLPPLYFHLCWIEKRNVLSDICFLAPLAAYAAWRLTGGFGYGIAGLAASSYFSSDAYTIHGLVLAAREIISWWVGGNFFSSVVSGWVRFLMILPKLQFLAVMTLLMFSAIMWWFLDGRSPHTPTPDSRVWKIRIFALSWMVFAYVPFLFFIASSRHNLFPAVGVALLIGSVVHGRTISFGITNLVILVFGTAVIGQSLEWRDSAILHRKVADHLVVTTDQWENADVVLLDTSALRERLLPGILADPQRIDRPGERYGTALLPRGFAYQAMMHLAIGAKTSVQAVLDTECGAIEEENTLKWHVRFDPSQPRSTPQERVFTIDVLSVALD